MSTKTPTLRQELEQFGEIRDGGCLLRVEQGMYILETSRNVFNRHRLSVEQTSDERLEAHWAQFVAANQ